MGRKLRGHRHPAQVDLCDGDTGALLSGSQRKHAAIGGGHERTALEMAPVGDGG